MNVYGFHDSGEFKSNSSKRNQLGGFADFDEFSSLSLLHTFLDQTKSFTKSLFYEKKSTKIDIITTVRFKKEKGRPQLVSLHDESVKAR